MKQEKRMPLGYYAIYDKENKILYKSRVKEHIGYSLVIIKITEEIYNNLHKYNYVDGELIYNYNYDLEQEEIKKQEERKRIANLKLTAADVERAIYKVKNLDFDDILDLVIKNPSYNIDAKALKIEFKANNFYRGNPYVDFVGGFLGFSSEQLDKFFEDGNYKHLENINQNSEEIQQAEQSSENIDEVHNDDNQII